MNLNDLTSLLKKAPLLQPGQLRLLQQQILPRISSFKLVLREMYRRKWLTSYQIKKIVQGKGARLIAGQFVVLNKLGQGGMGVVFKARRIDEPGDIALKCLRREMLASPVALERFQRETHVGKKLNHPNVVRVFEAGVLGSVPYLVMELVDGVTLSNLVREGGPMPVRTACEMIRQAAVALQHAHDHGLVHRDVKPSNLLRAMTPEGELIKLSDLGLARLVESANPQSDVPITHDGIMIGSADFIAPEQARNPRSVDIRADLYSLGCTFHFLLTGRAPYPGGTVMEKVLRHSVEDPPIVKHVSPHLQSVLQTMMAKKPEERYATPNQVVDVLQILIDEPDRLYAGSGALLHTTQQVVHLCASR